MTRKNIPGQGSDPGATSSLLRENAGLRARLAEAEETLRAIREGEVDALVVEGQNGEQKVFTLQGAETSYRFLVEAMNEGALLLLLDGSILYSNARFAVLAGVPLEQVTGSPLERFFGPADQTRLRSLLATAPPGGSRHEFLLSSCIPPRPVALSLASLRREGVEGFSVLVSDLTERKAAEEALRASNAKLREMVNELEHFSYSISHDMRAPLRAMKSFALILQESCSACTQVENLDLLERISTAASRLDALIQGSLDYARVLKQDLELEPVNLAKLLAGLTESYPNLLPEKADIQLQPGLPIVQGNEAALTQVFSNLLGNAIKFVAPGVRPRVRVWSESRQGRVRVWIEDNGIGIPPAAQSGIFEMFQRATKEYEGTGIGLAVVRKVVERIGGSVGVESEQGKGSRFWIDLQSA